MLANPLDIEKFATLNPKQASNFVLDQKYYVSTEHYNNNPKRFWVDRYLRTFNITRVLHYLNKNEETMNDKAYSNIIVLNTHRRDNDVNYSVLIPTYPNIIYTESLLNSKPWLFWSTLAQIN